MKTQNDLLQSLRNLPRILIGELVIGTALALFVTAFAFAADGGTVSGTIHVKKAYVETTGPKSDKDVVVYLEPVDKASFTAPKKHANMDQSNLNFVPHVLAVQQGATVDFLNEDSVNHNVSSPSGCCAFDLGQWGKGVVKSHLFDTAGVSTLLCSLHPEMMAYLVVVNTPYFTTASLITDNAAKKQSCDYSITGVPAGQYKLKAWNSKLSAADQLVTVTDGGTITADIDIHKK